MKTLTHDAQYICRNLEITEQEYCEMVYAGGLAWINHQYAPNQFLIDIFESNKWFWKWWVNQWEIRDRNYVNTNRNFNPWPPRINRRIYDGFHDVAEIKAIPNQIVLQEINKAIRAAVK